MPSTRQPSPRRSRRVPGRWRDLIPDAPREATLIAWVGDTGPWPFLPRKLWNRPVASVGNVGWVTPDERQRFGSAWRAGLREPPALREKAHTREGDAIAAARRRLPMVRVDAAIALRPMRSAPRSGGIERRPTNEKGSTIMKLTTITQVSVDGVMQGNGGRDENLDPGFERGGWARPLFDSEAMT